MGGGVDPRELGFLPPFEKFLDIGNDPWTGDGALSSPGGAGSIIYELQPTRDRPVGGIGDFHTLRGGINTGDMSVFVPGLSELYIHEWIMILGMAGNGPYRPQMTVTYVRSPANERPAIRQKGYTRNLMFVFSFRSSLRFSTTKLFVQCYRVLRIFHRPDESGLQQ